jgi:POT family proton-dependent oligopeptide transporter
MNENRLPPQTKYIVGNEACERFSFYGVIAILTGYTTMLLGGGDEAGKEAKEIVHWFRSAVYFLPLLGAWVADRWWGRYKTILWISMAYCAGHACLAFGEGTKWGLFTGLALLAIGSGGIKPSVSAFVGDQFGPGREHLLTKVYGLFYWSINFGSFFAFAFIPLVKANPKLGYTWAFGLPGIAMGLATFIFWLGSRTYVKRPPAHSQPKPDPAQRAENRATLLRIISIFAPVMVFWSLYDQQNTTWVQQGARMLPFFIGSYEVNGETMQSVNPILVMIYIPIFTYVLYPWLERRGLRPTPLRRMGTGMVLGAVSFLAAAVVQGHIESGAQLSVAWQFIQYGIMIAGEVLLSVTGLEFAFSQAPASMKSTIMSMWLLSVAFGNMLTASVTNLNKNFLHASGPGELIFYAALMLVVAGVFAVLARKFRERTA